MYGIAAMQHERLFYAKGGTIRWLVPPFSYWIPGMLGMVAKPASSSSSEGT